MIALKRIKTRWEIPSDIIQSNTTKLRWKSSWPNVTWRADQTFFLKNPPIILQTEEVIKTSSFPNT
ncbi:hypothetical protein MJO28_017703 [Puccinia striiformis f. sp. tritici]|nr:hypothetical protein MJO28_017703 [Puccinia striiformis f. sp. tritici]